MANEGKRERRSAGCSAWRNRNASVFGFLSYTYEAVKIENRLGGIVGTGQTKQSNRPRNMQNEAVPHHKKKFRVKVYIQILIFLGFTSLFVTFVFDTPFVRSFTYRPNRSSDNGFEFNISIAAEGWRGARLAFTLEHRDVKIDKREEFSLDVKIEDISTGETIIFPGLGVDRSEYNNVTLLVDSDSHPKLKTILSNEGRKRITVTLSDEGFKIGNYFDDIRLHETFFYDSALKEYVRLLGKYVKEKKNDVGFSQ